jgi:hypothetical protein
MMEISINKVTSKDSHNNINHILKYKRKTLKQAGKIGSRDPMDLIESRKREKVDPIGSRKPPRPNGIRFVSLALKSKM